MSWKKILIGIAVLIFTLCTKAPALADEWSYKILKEDTPININSEKTDAEVNTEKHEIVLPKVVPSKTGGFWADGSLDYYVMTSSELKHFSFDGATMVENPITAIKGLSDPVAAATSKYPDAVVATNNEIKHYSFTGTGMSLNPSLSQGGFTNILSVGSRESDIAILDKDQIKYYGFSGSSIKEVPYLSVSVSKIKSPIDFALFQDSYDTVVLEDDQLKYLSFTGSSMEVNPALSITGLNRPLAVATGDDQSVAIIDGNRVKRYTFNGSTFSYSAGLSVISGLKRPGCVALRPGSNDMLIVDGNEIKYYSYDGNNMVYNSLLSKTIEGLENIGNYIKSAVVESVYYLTEQEYNLVKVRAYHVLPNKTGVTWSVCANGIDWVTKWRVRGIDNGTITEVSDDNGLTWRVIGDAAVSSPVSNEVQLWADVIPGKTLQWKATLFTSDPKATPRIIAPNPGTDVAVLLNTNTNPDPPKIITPEGCYLTANPKFEWEFNDPDGDTQRAFQLIIKNQASGEVLYDTGKTLSSQEYHQLPNPTSPETPSIYWESGTNQFTLMLRVWDTNDAVSPWAGANFCILGLERPRIKEIIDPPAGQISPQPENILTHVMVLEGTQAEALPKIKAGAKVTVLIDAISTGSNFTAKFPYLNTQAVLESPPKCIETNGFNKRYEISFWTEASQAKCPAGTIIEAEFEDNGGASLYLPDFADGIAQIKQTMYENWTVVLNGRKK